MRLARAVRAGIGPAVATDPLLVMRGGAAAAWLTGRDQRDRLALDQEATRLEAEVAVVAVTVAQRDGLDADLHDVAEEPRGAVFDHHADGGHHLRIPGGVPLLFELVEDVGRRATTFVHRLTHHRVAVTT